MISYTATFSAIAVTADQDLFSITAPATFSVAIRRISIGQYSDILAADDEILPLQFIRGYTAVGSGGAAVTAQPLDVRRPAFGGTVRRNDDTIATTGTPLMVIEESFNIRAGWYWRTPDNDQLLPRSKSRAIWMDGGDINILRLLTNPLDSLTMIATIEFDQMESHDVDR